MSASDEYAVPLKGRATLLDVSAVQQQAADSFALHAAVAMEVSCAAAASSVPAGDAMAVEGATTAPPAQAARLNFQPFFDAVKRQGRS